MSFLNGIGINSLLGQFQIDKPERDLRDIQNSLGPNGTFRTTTRHKTQLANVEAQNEDNTTFLFEYRAMLNSQLTTLITKLTNALTADLDAMMAMGSWPSSSGGNNKSNMQGDTGIGGPTLQDPGAARVAWTFLGSFHEAIQVSKNVGGTWSGWSPDYTITGYDQQAFEAADGPDNGYGRKIFTPTTNPNASAAGPVGLGSPDANYADGTISIMTYGNAGTGDKKYFDDRLNVYYQDTSRNEFEHDKKVQINATDETALGQKAGNKFQEVLHKEARTRMFRDIVNAGLFRDLVVSSSTSLATGSQVQASIKLDMEGFHSEIVGGQTYKVAPIDMYINRFTAFYHT